MNENEYEISSDKKRLDLAMIHDFLTNRPYWTEGIPFKMMKSPSRTRSASAYIIKAGR